MRDHLIVLGSGMASAAACVAWLRFEMYSPTDPSWTDCYGWAVILLSPMAFSAGIIFGVLILGAIAFAKYVMSHSRGSKET